MHTAGGNVNKESPMENGMKPPTEWNFHLIQPCCYDCFTQLMELKSICQREFRTFMFITAQYPNDASNPWAHKQKAQDENVAAHAQLNTL